MRFHLTFRVAFAAAPHCGVNGFVGAYTVTAAGVRNVN